jgi:hypothetical protein
MGRGSYKGGMPYSNVASLKRPVFHTFNRTVVDLGTGCVRAKTGLKSPGDATAI